TRSCLRSFHAGYRNDAGRNPNSDGLVRAIAPHSTPSPAQERQSYVSSSSVNEKMIAHSRAESAVSQTHVTAQYAKKGTTAQTHDATSADFSSNTRRPIR